MICTLDNERVLSALEGFYIRIEFSELSRRDAAVTFVMGDCALPPFASPPHHANTGRAGDPGFAQDGAPSVVLVLERVKRKGGATRLEGFPRRRRCSQLKNNSFGEIVLVDVY